MRGICAHILIYIYIYIYSHSGYKSRILDCIKIGFFLRIYRCVYTNAFIYIYLSLSISLSLSRDAWIVFVWISTYKLGITYIYICVWWEYLVPIQEKLLNPWKQKCSWSIYVHMPTLVRMDTCSVQCVCVCVTCVCVCDVCVCINIYIYISVCVTHPTPDSNNPNLQNHVGIKQGAVTELVGSLPTKTPTFSGDALGNVLMYTCKTRQAVLIRLFQVLDQAVCLTISVVMAWG